MLVSSVSTSDVRGKEVYLEEVEDMRAGERLDHMVEGCSRDEVGERIVSAGFEGRGTDLCQMGPGESVGESHHVVCQWTFPLSDSALCVVIAPNEP